LKTTPDGQIVTILPKPSVDVYREGNYSPTLVAVDEERYGGSGDIWVADGYGESYVHRYDKPGRYIRSINGEEGNAGRFACPHGIFIDRRREVSELYIADPPITGYRYMTWRGILKGCLAPVFYPVPAVL
jgi:hypothetical protein